MSSLRLQISFIAVRANERNYTALSYVKAIGDKDNTNTDVTLHKSKAHVLN
jgi:hypothetical protein